MISGLDVEAAFYLPQRDADRPRRTTALLARVDAAGVLTDGILVEVTDTDQCPQLDCPVLDTVTVDGRLATLYQANSGIGYELRSLVIPPGDGTPAVTLSGADPVAFVEEAGGNPVHLLPDRSDGELDVELADLPDGYEVIIPPAPYVRGAYSAGFTFVPDPGSSPVSVIVQRNTDLLGAGRLGPIEPVDVNGSNAWTYDLGQGSPVIWQVSATTWITVAGAPDQATAIDIARSIEFVDRATWESTYGVSLDNFIPPTELPAIPVATGTITTPATTVPPLVALEETGVPGTDVPIGCGSIPPRDEPVDPPVPGSTPGDALAAFVEGNGLWRNGWTDTSSGPDAVHRFEYRRDDGLLVTVVYVEPAGGGWAVTRWLSTPC